MHSKDQNPFSISVCESSTPTRKRGNALLLLSVWKPERKQNRSFLKQPTGRCRHPTVAHENGVRRSEMSSPSGEEIQKERCGKRFKVKPIEPPGRSMAGLTLAQRSSSSVTAFGCASACMRRTAVEFLERGRGGEGCSRKASIQVVLLALALARLGGGWVNMGASHTGLLSITISLCCHGSQALSGVKISHCSERGLLCEHTSTRREGKRPVHLVLMLSHTLTSLLHASAGTSSCAPAFRHKGCQCVKTCGRGAVNGFI